jgi:signal transduction histidine kinase
VSFADGRRRTRRIALLLSAILIPTAAVILLVFRVVRQESELSERRATEQRREALDQLRRELTARLQALRLGEVNRLIGDPARRLPSDSPIVFVAPLVQDHGQDLIVPPWEGRRQPPRPTAEFSRFEREGESREFRQHDAAAAIESYQRAYERGRSGWERCSARVSLGRSYLKSGMTGEAARNDRAALQECGDVADADGIPLALYAAERLLTVVGNAARNDPPAADYVLRRAGAPPWRSPNEVLLLQSLLRRMAGSVKADLKVGPYEQTLRALEAEIRNGEQIAALVQDAHDPLGKLQQASRSAPGDLAWVGYGDEPWLLTLVSPTSFATPLVMAVSPRQILPAGVTLRVAPTDGTVPLGDGFVDLYARWPPARFEDSSAASGVLYGSMILVVLGAGLLAGYFLIRDVHRDAETAAMRSHFVASVSHELKTPLTSIRAHAETLLMGRAASPEMTADYLTTIVSESERLTRLVDSVLDFSRIEQGQRTYHLQDTPLDEVVRSAAKAMEDPLLQLGFTLILSSDGTSPAVRADREALTQAILNLLGNAMKYSGDARRIEMRTGTRNGEAFVDVVDHGIGIARDEQARIFERFHRARSVETTGIAGTGLGLTLALHVVEAHRGRIAVVSDPGCGSTFSVCIPLQAQA